MFYRQIESTHRTFKSTLLAAATILVVGNHQVHAANEAEKFSDLAVKITGIKKQQGSVRVAVFGSKDTWLKKPVFTGILKVEGKDIYFSKQQVPYGDYGIAIFHDKNDNGEMDSNFLGLPKEPYGFSNNARGSFGPAKWEKSKISISQPQSQFEVKIR